MDERNIHRMLKKVFQNVTKADIEDALQSAALKIIEKGDDTIQNEEAYQFKAARNFLINEKVREQRAAHPVAIEDVPEDDFIYDNSDMVDLLIDTRRVLEKYFTPKEQEILVEHLVDGVSSRDIAREHPERVHQTWSRWLLDAKALLREKLADYMPVVNGNASRRAA
jgi:DNA-directed RNA polymerase specialized sigma24 family protein